MKPASHPTSGVAGAPGIDLLVTLDEPGTYVFSHPFFAPGVIAIAVAVALGFGLGAMLL